MKTFSELRESIDKQNYSGDIGSYVLSEEIHQKIQDVMDSEMNPSRKLNAVTKTARELIASGQETGLESDKPKKGSSRAVFFPKDHKEIELDGHHVKTPSAVKIAFHGTLDHHTNSDTLLGQDQSEVESDHWVNHHYGIIREGDEKGKWETNADTGILPPHFGHHDEFHHIEMGKVEPITAHGFKSATKHSDFPNGITHTEFHDAVRHNWQQAHGQKHYGITSSERLEQLQEHPLVQNTTDFCLNTENHPGDFNKRNMGLWHHPVTGNKHVVISDFGYSKYIAKKYNAALKTMTDSQRRKLW
jgi:hypothetical protein